MTSGNSVNVTTLINQAIDSSLEGAGANFSNLAFKFQIRESEIHGAIQARLESGSLTQEQYAEVLRDLQDQNIMSVLQK